MVNGNSKSKNRGKNESKHYVSLGVFVLTISLLVLSQLTMSYFFSQRLDNLDNSLNDLSGNMNLSLSKLEDKVDVLNEDFGSQINELSQGLSDVEVDLGKQISSIKAQTSSDFSGIISNAINAVVSIKTDVAQGSGFIVSNDGYVVTNAHVLKGARFASAITAEQESKAVELIGYDFDLDLALLKMEGNFEYFNFADSDDVVVGEKVIAIGNPLGLSFSVSEGIVSAVDRPGDNSLYAYIQTDTALNSGNSGGPLINTEGKVIGINNFKIEGGENLGFALESNYIVDSINSMGLNKLNQTIIS